MFNRSSLKAPLVVSFSLVALALAACGKQPQGGGGWPPAEVSVIKVSSRNVPITYTFTGQTEGSREVEVRAQVGGILLSRAYKEGSTVTAGSTLFTIDPATYQATLAQAEAEVAGAQARLNQATRDAARLKPLFADKAVSQKDYDDAVSNEELSRANLTLAKAHATAARLNLAYTNVKAPITGISGRALKSEGNLLTPGADSLLTTLVQINPMYVNFSLSDNEQLQMKSEAQAGSLIMPKDGQFTVELTLANGSPYGTSGVLNFSETRVNRETGSIESRAEFANPAAALLPGQFVRVNLIGAQRPNAITVPQRAVVDGPMGKFVYAVGKDKEGKPVAEPHPITVGEWVSLGQGQNEWVVKSGLKSGDTIIVEGLAKLYPGAAVHVGTDAPATPKKP